MSKELADKELLELAAKAVGEITPSRWNPLTDDGDAFRLAVKLNMGISIPIHHTIRADVICFKNSAINAREEGDDSYTAARRAIVRVAAEIGKAKGEK